MGMINFVQLVLNDHFARIRTLSDFLSYNTLTGHMI